MNPWSVNFPSTLESLQKFEFEVNKDINSKAFLCQEDIAKLNGDAIVNLVSKTLIGGRDISESIYEATGPGFLDECQKLNDCETGECNVTNDYKLNDFYKSC